MAKNNHVIGGYKCGCTYGPVWRKDRLEYCGVHGAGIANEYEIPSYGVYPQVPCRHCGSPRNLRKLSIQQCPNCFNGTYLIDNPPTHLTPKKVL